MDNTIFLVMDTNISVEGLALKLVQSNDYDSLLRLIRHIDVLQEDWDFTKALYEHFKEMEKLRVREVGEDTE